MNVMEKRSTVIKPYFFVIVVLNLMHAQNN